MRSVPVPYERPEPGRSRKRLEIYGMINPGLGTQVLDEMVQLGHALPT